MSSLPECAALAAYQSEIILVANVALALEYEAMRGITEHRMAALEGEARTTTRREVSGVIARLARMLRAPGLRDGIRLEFQVPLS
jgi:hypothetical protein